jgi:hypothetical protein
MKPFAQLCGIARGASKGTRHMLGPVFKYASPWLWILCNAKWKESGSVSKSVCVSDVGIEVLVCYSLYRAISSALRRTTAKIFQSTQTATYDSSAIWYA